MLLEDLKLKKDLDLNEINTLLDNEKNIKVYKKLLYFKFKLMDYTKIEACNLAGFPESSRYYLDDLWEKGGYYALVPNYGGGRKSKLNEKQKKDLEIKLNNGKSWLIEDAKKLIKDEYGVEYTYQGVKNLLDEFNIKIDNYFEIERENKNPKNIVKNNDKNIGDEDNEIKDIIDLMKEEKSMYVYKKLIYLLLRKLGLSNKESSNIFKITTVTGNNWLKSWRNKGYDGLKRKPGQGRKPKLNEEEENILKKN